VLGTELRACGVDFSFTPVLDLDWQDAATSRSGVIGDRAFHRDPRVVAALAKSLMHGLLEAGMRNCGKHFPGHGFVKADSHHEVPVDKHQVAYSCPSKRFGLNRSKRTTAYDHHLRFRETGLPLFADPFEEYLSRVSVLASQSNPISS